MDYLSGFEQKSSKQHFVAVLFSSIVHFLIILFVMSAPFFKTRSVMPTDVVDVTLFDYAMSDISATISPAQTKPKESKPIEPPKPKELVDPSEAELKRMKQRQKDRTPPPDENAGDAFAMQKDLLPGGGGQTLGSMRVDAKDFPFLYYLSMMKSRVSENWIPPFGSFEADHKRVVIAFRIDRNGKLFSSAVEESSGDALLDQSALRAILVSTPFPPLPEGYADASLGVHFGFICKL